MNDRKELVEQELLAVLEAAILDEQSSTVRYRHGASIATDPEVKAMFEALVVDEAEHERVLKERYYAIKKRLGLKVMQEPTGE